MHRYRKFQWMLVAKMGLKSKLRIKNRFKRGYGKLLFNQVIWNFVLHMHDEQ
jgi:hypothetical protein